MSSTIIDHRANTLDEPLGRLVTFEPTTFPVLGVYQNTQLDHLGRAPDAWPYLHGEFKALARTWAPSSPELHSFDQDVQRITPIVTFIEDATLLESTGGVGALQRWRA